MAGAGDLPAGILGLIQSLLSLVDYLRFPAVCASWRHAAAENPRPPVADDFPWLLLPLGKEDQVLTVIRISPDNDPLAAKVYRIPVPEAIRGHRLVSAFGDGSILIEKEGVWDGEGYDREEIIQVVNPFSASWPRLGRFPYHIPWTSINMFTRVVTHGRIAVALVDSCCSLAYTTLSGPSSSNNPWHHMRDINDGCHIAQGFSDLVYSPIDGLFYALRGNADGVISLDFSSSRPIMRDVTLNLPPTHRLTAQEEEEAEDCLLRGFFQQASLIDSPHGVFVVRWRSVRRRRKVDVYKLSKNEWIPVRFLDDYSFFISRSGSLALPTAHFPRLMRNRMYFLYNAAMTLKDWLLYNDGLHYYNLVYNLEDGSWNHYYSSDVQGFDWIIPRLSGTSGKKDQYRNRWDWNDQDVWSSESCHGTTDEDIVEELVSVRNLFDLGL